MDVSTTAAPVDKSPDLNTAEEICKLLEQTMLKYFPQARSEPNQPKSSSVPLVPPRQNERVIKTARN